MNYKIVFPLVVLALLGLFFLGDGITGWIVSQSCCFPPNCPQEYMCEAASPQLSVQGFYVGAILLTLAVVGYLIIYRK
jgi:hypothetical protein